MLAMLPTLIAALLTGCGAGLDQRTGQDRIESRLTGEHPPGRRANIGAVLVEPNATPQHRHIALGQAGIGAGGADLRTLEAGCDARRESAALHRRLRGHAMDHPIGDRHNSSRILVS